MTDYFPKPPPPVDDARSAVEWAQRELETIARILGREVDVTWFRPLAVEPTRPRNVVVAFADGVNWDPGEGAGLYTYWNGVWNLVIGSGGVGVPVTSVFGRTGDIVAQVGDYNAFYSLLGHIHDDRYYTETEVDTALAGKSDVGHGHVSGDVSDFDEAVDDRVAALLIAGTNITLTYDDVAGSLTIDASGTAPVDSVFGRTGAVVAEVGDYSAFYSQLGHTHAAVNITYDNTGSGLAAVNVQAAIDEVEGALLRAGVSETISATWRYSSAPRLDSAINHGALTGDQNDFSPTGFPTATAVRVTPDAERIITGFAARGTGTSFFLVNESDTFGVTLPHENTGSTSGNRIRTPGALNYRVPPRGSVELTYVSSKWQVQGPHTSYMPLAGGIMTGELLIAGGTANAPGIAFGNDTNTGLYRVGGDQLGISAGGVQQALFTTSGNVLAGTNFTGTSSVGSFSSTGATGGIQLVSTGQINISVSVATSAHQQRFFNPNGMVGRITTDGTSTSFVSTSDKRMKKHVAKLREQSKIDYVARFDALEVNVFRWKSNNVLDYGVYAQDVKDLVPSAVSPGDKDTPWGIDHSKFVPLLIAITQDLRAAMQVEVAAREALEARVAALEASVGK